MPLLSRQHESSHSSRRLAFLSNQNIGSAPSRPPSQTYQQAGSFVRQNHPSSTTMSIPQTSDGGADGSSHNKRSGWSKFLSKPRVAHPSSTHGAAVVPKSAPSQIDQMPSLVQTKSINQYDRMFGIPPSTEYHPIPNATATIATTSSSSSSSKMPSTRQYPPPSSSTRTSNNSSSTTAGSLLRRASSFRKKRNDSNKTLTSHSVNQPLGSALPHNETEPSISFPSNASSVSLAPSLSATTHAASGGLTRLFSIKRRNTSGAAAVKPSPSTTDNLSRPKHDPIKRASSPPMAIISATWKPEHEILPPSTELTSHVQDIKPSIPQDVIHLRDDSSSSSLAAFEIKSPSSNLASSDPQPPPTFAAVPFPPIGATNLEASPSLSQSPHHIPRSWSSSGLSQTSSIKVYPSSGPLGHKSNSLSMSVLSNAFGHSNSSSPNVDQDPIARSTLTTSASTSSLTRGLSKRAQRLGFTKRPSTTDDSSLDLHQKQNGGITRKPSMRSLLKIPRLYSATQVNRPSTPEIESWRQRGPDGSDLDYFAERRRASEDALTRVSCDMRPAKISRTPSSVKRKPPPRVTSAEIASSTITPVNPKGIHTLFADQPLDSDQLPTVTLASAPVGQTGNPNIAITLANPNKVGLGLVAKEKETPLDPAPPSRNDGSVEDVQSDKSNGPLPLPSGNLTTAVISTTNTNLLAVPSSTGSDVDTKRPSTGLNSCDALSDGHRPWPLISAAETDTPLLRLQKLVVDTNGPDFRDGEDGLFFRPLAGHAFSAASHPVLFTTTEMVDHQETVLTPTWHENIEAQVVPVDSTVDDDLDLGIARTDSVITIRPGTPHGVPTSESDTFNTPQPTGFDSLAPPATTTRRGRPVPLLLPKGSLGESDILTSLASLPSPNPSSASNWNRKSVSSGGLESSMHGNRTSTASRLTVASSHLSDVGTGHFSEDALSALEAEVGRVRRAEVIALGKGRAAEWVGVIERHSGPILSRIDSFRKKPPTQKAAVVEQEGGNPPESFVNLPADEPLYPSPTESKALDSASGLENHDGETSHGTVSTSRQTHQPLHLVEAMTSLSVNQTNHPSQFDFQARASQPSASAFVRLSAFHDRKLVQNSEKAVLPIADEAVRLGRAPSKRVRRSHREVQSSGEAVIVVREPSPSSKRSGNMSKNRPSGRTQRSSYVRSREITKVESIPLTDSSLVHRSLREAGMQPLSSNSLSQKEPAKGESLLHAVKTSKLEDNPSLSRKSTRSKGGDNQRNSGKKVESKRKPSYATSEEAARARQRELAEREQRHQEREARKQVELQKRYVMKKRSDPLLATRLALMGLEAQPLPRLPTQIEECEDKMVPSRTIMAQQPTGIVAAKQVSRESDRYDRPTLEKSGNPSFTCIPQGLPVPATTEETSGRKSRQSDETGRDSLDTKDADRVTTWDSGLLAARQARHVSVAASLASFHTAYQGLSGDESGEGVAKDTRRVNEEVPPLPLTAKSLTSMAATSQTHLLSVADTSQSVLSRLSVDFEFPIPPQRAREEYSEDGTLLSRAGLREPPFWETNRDTNVWDHIIENLQQSNTTGLIPSIRIAHSRESPVVTGKDMMTLRRSRSMVIHRPRTSSFTTTSSTSFGSRTDAEGLGIKLPVMAIFDEPDHEKLVPSSITT